MEKRTIILSKRHNEVKVAVLEDNELVEYYAEREDLNNIVGYIFKGRISAIRRELQGIFVDIGGDIDGFLPLSDYHFARKGKEPKVGEEVIVQITKEPYGTKGPRLTMVITIPGRYMVLMPYVQSVGVSKKIEDKRERRRLQSLSRRILPRGMGAIIRTSATGVEQTKLKKEMLTLLKEWRDVQKKFESERAPALLKSEEQLEIKITRDLYIPEFSEIHVDSKDSYNRIIHYLKEKNIPYKGKVFFYKGERHIFENFGVLKSLDKIYRRKVWLKNGGYIVIDQTEAMHVIDVNSGKYSGKKNQEQMIFETNLLAAKEIARQLRLRDIGGIIVIDFIDMTDERNREKLLKRFGEYLKSDRTKVEVIDITGLGLVEVTRERIRRSVSLMFIEPCPVCSGKGTIFSKPYLLSLLESYIEKNRDELVGQSVTCFVHPILLEYIEEKGKERISSSIHGRRIHMKFEPDPSLPYEKIKIVRVFKDRVVEEDL